MTRNSSSTSRAALSPIRPLLGGGEALSLANQIALQLAEAIVNEDYAPGARIHEVAISERFRVSRGPVREALRILEKEGLVQILPRRGAIVTDLSVEEVEDVFELRGVLFGLAARRLALRGAPDVIAALNARVAALEALAGDDDADPSVYVAAVQELNLSMCRDTGSERLTSMVYSLFHQTLRYARLGLSTPERRQQSARNWAALADHVSNSRADAAEAAAKQLVDQSCAEAIRRIATQKAAGEAH